MALPSLHVVAVHGGVMRNGLYLRMPTSAYLPPPLFGTGYVRRTVSGSAWCGFVDLECFDGRRCRRHHGSMGVAGTAAVRFEREKKPMRELRYRTGPPQPSAFLITYLFVLPRQPRPQRHREPVGSAYGVDGMNHEALRRSAKKLHSRLPAVGSVGSKKNPASN